MTIGAFEAPLGILRAEALVERVQALILAGNLQPGDHLGTKDDLRRRFGVAAGTVNEAVRVLQSRGFVQARTGPKGGLFVARPSVQVRVSELVLALRHEDDEHIAEHCLAVRSVLDPLVAEEAARWRTPDDLDDLRRLLDQMAASLDDTFAYLASNWALHRRLARIGRNTVLTNTMLALLEFMEQEFGRVEPDPTQPLAGPENLLVHQRLVEAVASGDPDRAVEAAWEHQPRIEPGGSPVAAHRRRLRQVPRQP